MRNQKMPERFSEWNEEMVARHDPERFHAHPRGVVRWVERKRVKSVLRLLMTRHDDRVLEVACGGGHVIGRLHCRERHALDLSRRMVRRAHVRLSSDAVLLGDAEQLPYRCGVFDRVICTSVLSHVLHPERVLNECLRVLKPGGRLVVSISYEAVIERGIRLARRLGLGFLLGSRDAVPSESVYASEYHLHHFDLDLLHECAAALPREETVRRVPLTFYPAHLVVLYVKPTGA
jgi:SAM-dependent methyltransferase